MKTTTSQPLSPADRRLMWQTRSALCMLAAGFGLGVAGFCVEPLGEVSDSVMWIFSQCLLYAGSIFGVTTYAETLIDNRLQRLSHERPRQGTGSASQS